MAFVSLSAGYASFFVSGAGNWSFVDVGWPLAMTLARVVSCKVAEGRHPEDRVL